MTKTDIELPYYLVVPNWNVASFWCDLHNFNISDVRVVTPQKGAEALRGTPQGAVVTIVTHSGLGGGLSLEQSEEVRHLCRKGFRTFSYDLDEEMGIQRG